MRCGLLTDGIAHLGLAEALVWCARHDIVELELGTGGYSGTPHADRAQLLTDGGARDRLLGAVREAGCRIAALNASGNPLHPRADVGAAHDAGLRESVRLAALLGVDRVVAMSGCPGGPGDSAWPVFAGGAWLPDMEGLWDWQWRERIAPYWQALSTELAREAPAVVVCLELHPGSSIYNAASYHRLREVAGDNVLVNLDPSHFWWQDIDPIVEIAALDGCIGFAHGKDTLLHPDRIALHGRLDFRWTGTADDAWHFCAVGDGHDERSWQQLIAALRTAGHDGVVSIEHEDPRLTPEQGVERSLERLRRATAVEVAA